MNRKMMAALLLTSALTTTAQTEPIRIDLGQKGAVVSPNLYGIFFEEISHAGDGGLYAELVQNRGFEEHVLPSGMTYRDGKAYAPDAMNYEHRNNRNWNIPWNMEEKKMTGWKVTGLKATVKGKVITLNGDAKDENTFEQPTKLAPRTTLFGKFGRQFDYEFPAMSFTVMRVKVSK